MAEPLPVIVSFQTSTLPLERRFSVWEEFAAPTHHVTRPLSASPFFIDAFMCTFGDLVLSHGRYAQQVFQRSPQHIRRDHLDHYGVFAQGEGTRTLDFGPADQPRVAYPGDLIFFDMYQPGDSFATDGGSGTLYFPRPVIDALLPNASRFHGSILHGPIARLVAEHIHVVGGLMMREVLAPTGSAGDAASGLSSPSYHRLVRSTRDLTVACLLDTLGREDDRMLDLGSSDALHAFAARDDALRAAIVRFIDLHLADPTLDIPTIGAAFALSRSVLYRLFSSPGDEGIARLIKRRRLARIRAIVLANNDHRPLVEIAYDYGFRTASHFSREFRAEFGYPPGDLRALDDAATLSQAKRSPSLEAIFHALAVA